MPKRHLAYPSLAVAALEASPPKLRRDLETFGLLFESLVVRDLRIYAQAVGGHLTHYRDSNGLEIDVIVERRDGSWLAVEVKLGGEQAIEQAARSLRKLRDTVNHDSVGSPSDLVVVTAGGYGYRRDDGVVVLPITVLGP